MEIKTMTDAERIDYEERAAIIEYDGGYPRYEAERMALDLMRTRKATLKLQHVHALRGGD